MDKLDLAKVHKAYYRATQKPEMVDIESASYVAIRGKGDPSSGPFQQRLEALYSVAYTLKFAEKSAGADFVVAKLEGQWWFGEGRFRDLTIETSSVEVPRSEWEYRLMIRLPDVVSKESVDRAKSSAFAKKGLALLSEVEYYQMHEGRCVQMLHVGPFSTEPVTLAILGRFMEEHGLQRNGLHHEIYLSDFRKTVPEKLKTILREPVRG